MANERARYERTGTLAPLDELKDYKVADGDPDVRGWKVRGADGTDIGRIHELIVDTGVMKARYLDVEIDRRALERSGAKDDRHVLVPIGCARVDETDDHVQVSTLSPTNIERLPSYDHGAIDEEMERTVRDCHDLGAGVAAATADFYSGAHFDDRQFWGQRRRGRETEPYLSGPRSIDEDVEVRRPMSSEERADEIRRDAERGVDREQRGKRWDEPRAP